jgi:hypothetical protein
MHNGVNIRYLNGVEASTSQFPLIGYTVFWRLAGIRVSHPDLEQALQSAGFDNYLPDPPTPHVALRRALIDKGEHAFVGGDRTQIEDAYNALSHCHA